MNAYFVAATFPFLRVQLVRSAGEAPVVPVYMQLRMRASKEEVSRQLSTLLNCLLLVALLLTLGLGNWCVLRRRGLDPTCFAQAVALTPLLYLVVPLSLVTGLAELHR